MSNSTLKNQRRELAQLLGGLQVTVTATKNHTGHGPVVAIKEGDVPGLLATLREVVAAAVLAEHLSVENRRLHAVNERLQFKCGDFQRTAEQQANRDSYADFREEFQAARAKPVDGVYKSRVQIFAEEGEGK